MRGSKLTPIAEAARILEIGGARPALWLLRRLRSFEAEHSVTLLVSTGTSQKKPRYRVSLVKLRRHMPELFDVDAEGDAAAAAAAAAFTKVLRKLETIDDRIDMTEQRLGSIGHALARNRQK